MSRSWPYNRFPVRFQRGDRLTIHTTRGPAEVQKQLNFNYQPFGFTAGSPPLLETIYHAGLTFLRGGSQLFHSQKGSFSQGSRERSIHNYSLPERTKTHCTVIPFGSAACRNSSNALFTTHHKSSVGTVSNRVSSRKMKYQLFHYLDLIIDK